MEQRSSAIGVSDAKRLGERLTSGEYADLARVSIPTLRRWARQGIGPRPVRIGPRLVRYDKAEVLAYLRIGECRESA